MQEEPLAGKGHHSLSCVGTPARRPRSPLVAARIKREKWLYADFHLKCLKCLSLPSLPLSSSSVAAAELSPTKRRPSSAVWALSSLDKERASERHFARGKILSGVFKGPEIRLLLLIVTSQTRTRHAFALCLAATCLACFHDLYSLV